MTQETNIPTARRGRPVLSRRQKTDMRERIAHAAARLFEADGFSKVSMRRIAADVGCSPMTLYKYYDAKIDILRTLWADVFEDVFAKLEEAQNNTLGPQAQLRLLASTYLNFWLDNPHLYRLVFMAEGVTQPDVSIFVGHDHIAGHYMIFVKSIEALNPDIYSDLGRLKADFDGFICFLHGIAHNRITISGYDWTDTDKLIDQALRSLLGPYLS